MDFVLTVFALSGFALHSGVVHLILLVAHGLIGGAIAWRLLRRQPLTAFFLVVYATMYFPNPIAVILEWIPLESPESIFYSSNALIMLGFDLFLIAARRFRLTKKDANRMPLLQLQHISVDMCIAICFALSAVILAVLVSAVGKLGMNAFTLAKSDIYQTGEHNLYYLSARYCLMLLPLATFLVGLKRLSWQLPYMIPIVILLVVEFMVFRNRQVPVSVLFAYVVSIVAKSYFVRLGRSRVRGRLPHYVRLGLFLGVPLIAVVAISIKYVRASYAMRDWAVTQERIDLLIGKTFAGGDFGFSTHVRMAIRLFPDQHPYLWGQSYYRILFAPIPRSIWPEKPKNTQRIFAATMDPDLGRSNVTIPAGLVGDQYINFGYAGVLCMLAIGAFFANERYRGLTDLLYLAGSPFWIPFLARGSSTNPVVVLIVIWIISALITKFLHPTEIPRETIRRAPLPVPSRVSETAPAQP